MTAQGVPCFSPGLQTREGIFCKLNWYASFLCSLGSKLSMHQMLEVDMLNLHRNYLNTNFITSLLVCFLQCEWLMTICRHLLVPVSVRGFTSRKIGDELFCGQDLAHRKAFYQPLDVNNKLGPQLLWDLDGLGPNKHMRNTGLVCILQSHVRISNYTVQNRFCFCQCMEWLDACKSFD